MEAGGATVDGADTQVQRNGKGKFVTASLRLQGGVVELTEGGASATMDVRGCTVGPPKKTRKGQEYSLRLDLAKKDSTGTTKYLISFQDATQLEEWMSALQAASSGSTDDTAAKVQAMVDETPAMAAARQRDELKKRCGS